MVLSQEKGTLEGTWSTEGLPCADTGGSREAGVRS